MKTPNKFFILLLTISLLLMNMSVAIAFPPLPSGFYGTVKINGVNVAAGTKISGWINGVKYAETTVLSYQGNTVYSLDVPGDDSDSAGVIDGGVSGNVVSFHINDLVALQTGSWVSGTNIELNLTAVQSNTAPIAVNDTYVTGRDQPLNVLAGTGVLANDSDPDGDALSAVLLDAPATGVLALNSNGSFTFSPAVGFTGEVYFTYRAYDGQNYSPAAQVKIIVSGIPVTGQRVYLPLLTKSP